MTPVAEAVEVEVDVGVIADVAEAEAEPVAVPEELTLLVGKADPAALTSNPVLLGK